jgi:hypothetical protein
MAIHLALRSAVGTVVILVAVLMMLASSALSQQPDADVVLYGDHVPEFKRHDFGETPMPFINPFDAREEAVDPFTRLVVEPVAGLRNPIGTLQWGQTTFGKFVILGDFQGLFFTARQAIGVFDSEEKTFVAIHPSTDPDNRGTQRSLVTATPNLRRSRIFWAGEASPDYAPAVVPGHAGYIEADLDVPPAQWPIRILGAEVSEAGFDGVGHLWHEEPGTALCPTANPYGCDWVVLQAYYGRQILVVRVDGTSNTTVAVHDTAPQMHPGCSIPYGPHPVFPPAIDRSRPRTDRRWISTYDMLGGVGTPSPGCPGFITKRMQEFSLNIEAPGTGIVPKSPLFHGPNAGIQIVSDSFDSRGGLWVTYHPAGETPRLAIYLRNGGGEHSYFDPTQPTATVTVAPDVELSFDHQAGTKNYAHWIAESYGMMFMGGPQSIQRARTGFGAWVKDGGYKISLGRDVLPTEPRECSGYQNEHGVNVHQSCACPSGTTADQDCEDEPNCGPTVACSAVLRACATPAKLSNTYLACECPPAVGPDATCPHPNCPAGQSCTAFGEDAFGDRWGMLSIGGAPTSLFMPYSYGTPIGGSVFSASQLDSFPSHNLYLLRVPIVTVPPDGTSDGPPTVTWAGGKLWFFAERSGVLKYRVRDKGLWSSWFDLPANVSLAPGAAAISSETQGIEVFARRSGDLRIHSTHLADPACTPGVNCMWESWTAGPSAVVASNDEPAAAYDASGVAVVAIRNAADGRIEFSRRTGPAAWSAWTKIPNLISDRAPALGLHGDDGELWVVAHETNSELLRRRRLNTSGGIVGSWSTVGASGTNPSGWATAAALAFEPGRMRVLAASTDAFSPVLQTIFVGGVADGYWTNWQTLASEPISTRRPALAVVNGDTNLFTNWLNTIQETLVK